MAILNPCSASSAVILLRCDLSSNVSIQLLSQSITVNFTHFPVTLPDHEAAGPYECASNVRNQINARFRALTGSAGRVNY